MLRSMDSNVQNARGAHPLRWWSGEQQSHLGLAMERALWAWEQDWGLERTRGAEDAVSCVMAFEEAGSHLANWKPAAPGIAAESACELWWDFSPVRRAGDVPLTSHAAASETGEADVILVLSTALFGAPSERTTDEGSGIAEVAAEIAKSAWTDLWHRIRHILEIADTLPIQPDHLPAALPSPRCFQRWSGAVIVAMPWCGQVLRILLGGREAEAFLRHQKAIAPRFAAEKAAIAPVWEAVSPLACAMRAELEPVDLSLGEVKALRIGDVIELTHALDRPLLAKAATGELLCEAFLGRVGAHRAIELLRSPSMPF
jgi:hypothetical protein